jgi:hypothetical protein
MQRTLPILVAALAFALVPALAPAAARASAGQESLFQEDDLLLRTDASGREATLDQLQALGVDTIHTLVGWSALAPPRPPRPGRTSTRSTRTTIPPTGSGPTTASCAAPGAAACR